jgi:hypothetical protein
MISSVSGAALLRRSVPSKAARKVARDVLPAEDSNTYLTRTDYTIKF